MKIRSKIRILTSIPLVLFLGVFLVLYWTAQEVIKTRELERFSDNIVRAVFDLNLTADQYFSDKEERPRVQFQVIHDSMKRRISEAQREVGEERSILKRIGENHDIIGSLFPLLVSLEKEIETGKASAVSMAQHDRIRSQLLARLRDAVSSAVELSSIYEKRTNKVQTRIIYFIVFSLSFFGLAMVLFLYWTGKSISGPIQELQEGTKAISNGNLNHRIPVRGHDEIGQLSRAFNEMSEKLGLTLRNLEDEITERKLAEKKIKKANDDLEMRVQERTSELSEVAEKLRIENTQRRSLEETLRESESQVRFFASQYLKAQEEERRRIAGELHDSIAASLSGLKYRIEKIAEEMKQGVGDPDSLQDIAPKIMEINSEVRRIMADLRPAILDDLGIVPAMNWFCREYQKTYSHISLENQIGIAEEEVPESLKTPIFRISQEAMNNIAKYSKASLVNLSLLKEDDKINLTIQDNGQGFDLKTVRKGMGLSTMRERAQLSGGSFGLESAVGQGTVVRAVWNI
ncbi:MAG: HAMP domain-containing protein [Deltaproteobacteria bacterium]|nr:HAMP domain-containing protein [Deltaproteobacteria bacterium]